MLFHIHIPTIFLLEFFKEIKLISAAITTIKQSNLYPFKVIHKLPSTSTVQAASESEPKVRLFTEIKGDYMK